MNNDNRLSQKQVDELLHIAAEKTGHNPESVKEAMNSGKFDDLLDNLKSSDMKKIKKLMQDKEATEQLLSTPQAQELLKRIFNK